MKRKICPDCGRTFNQSGKWQVICRRCYAISKSGDSFKKDGVHIEVDLLKKIRLLCHPDKHDGSELSTSVTAEINLLMNKIKSLHVGN